MTFPTTINPTHEVTPARLQAPGVVAHKDEPLMSKQHGTDTTSSTTDAEARFWADLRQFADEHDTGDLSVAAQLVHDAVRHNPRCNPDDSRILDVTAFRNAETLAPAPGGTPEVLERLDRLERKLDDHRNATTDLAAIVIRGLWGEAKGRPGDCQADKSARVAEIHGFTGALADALDEYRVVDAPGQMPSRRHRLPGERYSDAADGSEQWNDDLTEAEQAVEALWVAWKRAQATERTELAPPKTLAHAARARWAECDR